MGINLSGIIIIVGNYGSGKTEVSVNLAANQKRKGINVCVADLDLVNPYFRTREAINSLSKLGVDVIAPEKQYLKADLPILSPKVIRLIRQPGQLAILDAGGDGVGSTVLAALGDSLNNKKIRMLQVVNPFRPFTDTIDGCINIREQIEKASNLTINGIISNTNLIDQTTKQDIYKGYGFVKSYAVKLGLPLEFITASKKFMSAIRLNSFSCPVLPIERQLVPPWKNAEKFS